MDYNNYYPVQSGYPPPGPPGQQHQASLPPPSQMMQPGGHLNNMMHHTSMPPQVMRQNITPGPPNNGGHLPQQAPSHLGPHPHQMQNQHQPPPHMQQHPHMQSGGTGGPHQPHVTNHYHQLPPHPPLPHSASPHHPSPHHTPNHLLQQPPRPSTGPSPISQPPSVLHSPHSNHLNGPSPMLAPQQQQSGSHPTPPHMGSGGQPAMGPPSGSMVMPHQHQNQNFIGSHIGPSPPNHYPSNQPLPPNHGLPQIAAMHHGGPSLQSSYVGQSVEQITPPYQHHIPQTEFRLIELNRRLQGRPRPKGPPTPLPILGSMEESIWWDRFASEFFDDDSSLTLRILVDDKPTDYTIGRTLIPRFFRSYFDGGVADLQIKLRNIREISHSPTMTTLECDQADIITKNYFKHPANPNIGMNAIIHTEGYLSLDFVNNGYDNLLIKSWKFFTHQCHEYIDRSMIATGFSNTFLIDPVTKMGLTKATLVFLKMCMIMEPMQDLMLQHRQTKMDPRACLKHLLQEKYGKTPDDNRAVPTKRRKRKTPATAGGATGGGSKRGKTNSANNSNASGSNSNMMSPSTMTGIPRLSLASQDLMVVGEPSMMGADFGDENERRITRLETNQFDSSAVTDSSNGKTSISSSNAINQPTQNGGNKDGSDNVSKNNLEFELNSDVSHLQQDNLEVGGSSTQVLNNNGNNDDIQESSDTKSVNEGTNCLSNNSNDGHSINAISGSITSNDSNDVTESSQLKDSINPSAINPPSLVPPPTTQQLSQKQPPSQPKLTPPLPNEESTQVQQPPLIETNVEPTNAQTLKNGTSVQIKPNANAKSGSEESVEQQRPSSAKSVQFDDKAQISTGAKELDLHSYNISDEQIEKENDSAALTSDESQMNSSQTPSETHSNIMSSIPEDREDTCVRSASCDLIVSKLPPSSNNTSKVGLSSNGNNNKQNRRRSSERKETLREGLMRTSDFVVAMKDLKSENPALWRITTGNNLLQQFEPKTSNGVTLYENTNQYAGWNPEIKREYVGVDVKLTQHTRNQITVERLHLNFQKVEDANTFFDRHFAIYLQILISTALDPKFWESIENEPEHHDYFLPSHRIIEDINKRYKSKLSGKLKLNEGALKNIEKYPNFITKFIENGEKAQSCRACNTNTCTQIVTFENRSYDLHSYKPVKLTAEASDDSDYQNPLCVSCLEIVNIYSEIHHMGFKFFNLARDKAEPHRAKGKKMHETVHECMKDEDWMTSMYVERDTLWSKVEKI